MTIPSVENFQDYFTRDFPYGSTPDKVNDSDISRAITEAGVSFNSGLFSTDALATIGYLYLTAHIMVLNLRASSQGIQGGYSWLQASKSVGSVSESSSIPQRILDSPEMAMLSKTTYGARYLELVLPSLAGQIFTVEGPTKA